MVIAGSKRKPGQFHGGADWRPSAPRSPAGRGGVTGVRPVDAARPEAPARRRGTRSPDNPARALPLDPDRLVSLGQKLFRELPGTKAEQAARLGTSRSTIITWRAGRVRPDTESRAKIL